MRTSSLLVGVALLCGTAAISSQVAGQGAATTGAGKTDATKVGAARAVENEVEGRIGNAVQKLAVGSEVFQNQLVRTGRASTARLQFLDETNLGLSPQTQIRLDSFVYDPDTKTGKVVVHVPYGLVRFVTGSLEKQSYTIRTPFVAVGVRGTTFDMLVRRDRVTVLLVEGDVELTVQPRGTYLLERPNTAITIWQDGRVNGPREWTRSVTEFAALPAQRRDRARPADASGRTRGGR
ncbi:MAG: FecR family protein, partial [Xanthobacteraceae bacterium]|nr:FecR family protein [Xanthobacteraceae bacterium]